MKVTIIDQQTDTVHQVSNDTADSADSHALRWFDPLPDSAFCLEEETENPATSQRIRFRDGREVEIDCDTGELLTV